MTRRRTVLGALGALAGLSSTAPATAAQDEAEVTSTDEHRACGRGREQIRFIRVRDNAPVQSTETLEVECRVWNPSRNRRPKEGRVCLLVSSPYGYSIQDEQAVVLRGERTEDVTLRFETLAANRDTTLDYMVTWMPSPGRHERQNVVVEG